MKPWTSVLGPSFARTFFCVSMLPKQRLKTVEWSKRVPFFPHPNPKPNPTRSVSLPRATRLFTNAINDAARWNMLSERSTNLSSVPAECGSFHFTSFFPPVLLVIQPWPFFYFMDVLRIWLCECLCPCLCVCRFPPFTVSQNTPLCAPAGHMGCKRPPDQDANDSRIETEITCCDVNQSENRFNFSARSAKIDRCCFFFCCCWCFPPVWFKVLSTVIYLGLWENKRIVKRQLTGWQGEWAKLEVTRQANRHQSAVKQMVRTPLAVARASQRRRWTHTQKNLPNGRSNNPLASIDISFGGCLSNFCFEGYFFTNSL